MPKFDTPDPISVTLDLGVGQVRFAASDRTDTVVDVRPTDESDSSDVKAAQQVRVDYSNGTLHVTGPKMRAFDFSRKTRSVDVTVELPAGSRISAEVQAGAFQSTGQLGQARFKTAAGNVSLDRTDRCASTPRSATSRSRRSRATRRWRPRRGRSSSARSTGP